MGLHASYPLAMEQPSINKQGAFWGSWAVGADRGEGKGERYVDRVCAMVREVATRCAPVAAGDVGCGTGWLVRVLEERFKSVWGIEIGQEALEVARVRSPNADLQLGNFLETDDLPKNLDLVISHEVIAHVADQSAFIARCAAMLAPGGRFLLFTQNPVAWSRTRYVSPPSPDQIRHWLSTEEIRVHCALAGLQVVKVTTLTPHGDRGALFWRPYANGIIRRLIGRSATEWIFERMGLGRTIVVEAVKSVQS